MMPTIRRGHHHHRHRRRPFLLCCNLLTTVRLSSSLSASSTSAHRRRPSSSSHSSFSSSFSSFSSSFDINRRPPGTTTVVTIGEDAWRDAACRHSRKVESLLRPGLLPPTTTTASSRRRRGGGGGVIVDDGWTALDPRHPVYNFLIEYYGLVGAKGPRRLARWSPDPGLLLLPPPPSPSSDNVDGGGGIVQDFVVGDGGNNDGSTMIVPTSDVARDAAMMASGGMGGIILENASTDDVGRGTLHLRGSVNVPGHGMLYHPGVFYGMRENDMNENENENDDEEGRRQRRSRTIAPFQWYASILRTTLDSEPVLHCHGLHEWAMLYHPPGASPPPSASYQSHLTPRVSREVINGAVERRGVHCTHVDALRFFAPSAGPLNRHGAELVRTDQLRLEQGGCVHAHMDMLKIGLKLGCFVDSNLMSDILEVALDARRLDVAASPYDVMAYGLEPIPIETSDGRRAYRREQADLMRRAESVRGRLLDAYGVFVRLAFDEDLPERRRPSATSTDVDGISTDDYDAAVPNDARYVAPERLATTRPGGLPWRRSIIVGG